MVSVQVSTNLILPRWLTSFSGNTGSPGRRHVLMHPVLGQANLDATVSARYYMCTDLLIIGVYVGIMMMIISKEAGCDTARLNATDKTCAACFVNEFRYWTPFISPNVNTRKLYNLVPPPSERDLEMLDLQLPSHFHLRDLTAITAPAFELKYNAFQESAAKSSEAWFRR